MPRFELTILGCGSAKPSLRHLPSSQVINVRERLLMFDCGEGTQLEMMRRHIPFSRLRHIFISHLHGDHCLGVVGLVSTLALHDLQGKLVIHTFADGARLMGEQIDYYCHERPFELEFNIIGTKAETIFDDDAIEVTTIPLRHRVPAVGFLVREKPKSRHINPVATAAHGVPHWAMRALKQGEDFVDADGVVVPNSELTTDADPSYSYAYCSDTRPSERVIEAVKGVDWLYHEATYADAEADKALKHNHSTARQAAQVAAKAGVKQLIIGHYSSRYDDLTPLLEQARQEFPATRLAHEGMVIDLNKP